MKLNLPKDAEGKPIPLDTEYLYTYKGKKQDVLRFTYYKKEDRWEIETDSLITNSTFLYLTRHDCLEQLADDLDRMVNDSDTAACTYLNRDKCNCYGCKFQKTGWDSSGHKNCTKPFLLDVAARVHRLAGDAE